MIYMDNGATTRLSEKALTIMQEYYLQEYANPSANYRFSRTPAFAIEQARGEIAKRIGAKKSEIFFTSGGSEGNSLVLQGCLEEIAITKQKPISEMHIILSNIEHSNSLLTAKKLEKMGCTVSYARADEKGIVSPEEIIRLIRPETVLISVMYANNEIGTLQPIQKIGAIAKEKGIFLHTDAVAAIGQCRIDVNKENIDYLTVSAHKLKGPKGVGFLYKKETAPMSPYVCGTQEKGIRGGTENVPGILGMQVAFCERQDEIEDYQLKLQKKRTYFMQLLKESMPDVVFNGDIEKRLAGNIHFSIPGISAERMIMLLDMEEIYLSTGAACTSRKHIPSHVLTAIGLPEELKNSSFRVTLSLENTEEDIETVIQKMAEFKEKCKSTF